MTAPQQLTPESPNASKPSIKGKFWIGLGSGLLAFIIFLITPLGQPLQDAVYGFASPIFRRFINNGLSTFGVSPVNIENISEFNRSTYTVTTPVSDGEPAPAAGCVGTGWLKQHGGLPIVTEMYAEVITSRSDVTLVAADLRYSVKRSAAKAVVVCLEGGDGAVTVFSYKVLKEGHLERQASGPGASETGEFVSLHLEPGKSYPVAVIMQVEGLNVVDWQADLRFRVGDKDLKRTLDPATTAGAPKELPRFVAEDGRWRKSS
jgi:hypothetical protein